MIALVLVAYENTVDQVVRGVDRWQHQTLVPDGTYVVANSPVDLPSDFDDRTQVLRPATNLGFAGGVNLAANEAWIDGYQYLLLSNLDVEILSSELVEKLLAVFGVRSDCAFVSPGIVLWPDTSKIWYRGAHVVRPVWVARHPGIGRPWTAPPRGIVMTGYFTGCCALIDLEKFHELGGFDETLFMYYDEPEIAERAARSGWHSYFVDLPLLAHAKHGRSFTSNEAYWHARNSAMMLRRYEHGPSQLIGRIGQWILAPLQLLRCDSAGARKSYMAGLLGRPLMKEL
jgi:N-acetylglucosaminyl-diphospho-decaprenol L-rhamnosyltransferase